MINPVAELNSARLEAETPLPMKTGRVGTALETSSSSRGEAGEPVLVPVIITPSERKKSAAFAVSMISTSLVTE